MKFQISLIVGKPGVEINVEIDLSGLVFQQDGRSNKIVFLGMLINIARGVPYTLQWQIFAKRQRFKTNPYFLKF